MKTIYRISGICFAGAGILAILTGHLIVGLLAVIISLLCEILIEVETK